MHVQLLNRLLIVCLGTGIVLGCSRGPSRPKTYPVSGTVTLNGQPVEGATVVFVPKSVAGGPAAPASAQAQGPQVATGETDAQGRYQLGTFGKGDGAVPGEYLVKVFKYSKPQVTSGTGAGEDENYQPPDENAPPPPPLKSLLPEKYANENTSGLSFTVEPKNNTFDIQLSP